MPLDPLTAGALISAGGSLLGNLFGNRGSRRAQERAQRFNIEFWNMQNRYNHPKEQMKRLRDAGLNPNLIYGTSPTSAVGNAQAIAPAKAPEHKIDNPLSHMAMYAAVKNTEAQTDNLIAQNDVIVQEAALKAAQTAGQVVKTGQGQFDLDLAKELRKTSVDAAKENLRQMELRSVGFMLDNTFKNRAMSNQLKKIMYDAYAAKETLEGVKLDNAMKDLDIQLKKLGIEKGDPWYFRIMGRMLTD